MGNPNQLCYCGGRLTIRIFEIFNSISGEVGLIPQGALTTFIRFAGCNLKCKWCDTKKSQSPKAGSFMDIDEIVKQVEAIGCPNIILTGGEPLLQQVELCVLVKRIKRAHPKWVIQVETNGTLTPLVTTGVNCWVVDYKLPGSGAESRWGDLFWLPQGRKGGTYLKFVCSNRKDFERAIQVLNEVSEFMKTRKPTFAFSAVSPSLKPAQLVKWLQEKKVWEAIVNVQIHKVTKTR